MSTHGPADPWNEETVNRDAVSSAPQQPSAQPSDAADAPAGQTAPPPQSTPPASVPSAQPSPPVQSAPPAQSAPPMYQPTYPTYQPQQYEPQYQQYPPQYQPQASYGPPAYEPQYADPQYAQPAKSSRAVVVLSVLLAVVVLVGAGLGIYLFRTRSAATPPPAVPTVNECLVSHGAANPKLTPAGCGPNTYKVLKVQSGTTDTSVCNGVSGVTDTYKFEWPVDPNVNNYVLCLQKQTQ